MCDLCFFWSRQLSLVNVGLKTIFKWWQYKWLEAQVVTVLLGLLFISEHFWIPQLICFQSTASISGPLLLHVKFKWNLYFIFLRFIFSWKEVIKHALHICCVWGSYAPHLLLNLSIYTWIRSLIKESLPMYRSGNWGKLLLSKLAKITWLLRGDISTQASVLLSLKHRRFPRVM